MAVHDIARIEDRIDRAAAGGTEVSAALGGVQFRNMIEIMEAAKLLAISGPAIPKWLQGNVGGCWAVIVQAVEWGFSPIAVARMSYEVSGVTGYMAQLVHAVIEKRAPIVGRLRHKFEGEGDERVCIVWAQVKGEAEPLEYRSPPFGRIQPKNSPLWKTKPDLQQYYNTSRDFCRVYFPDVLLGVYAEDELRDSHIGPDKAKDVTPDKPKFGTFKKGKRGFDADHVERETKPTEPEAQGSAPGVPEPQVSAEASASPADANGAADTIGTPAAPHPLESEADAVQRLVRVGQMSANEARAAGGLPPINETTEIAGDHDKPASGAEARAAGSVQGEGGPPSYYLNPFPPNIWAQYADWFVDKHTVSDIRKADTAWWKSHAWPDDDELKDKHRRIRKIHERRVAGEIDADQFTAQIREAVAS